MPISTIYLTQGYSEAAYYPLCAASNAIARAFNARTISRPALIAFQDMGVTVVIDGQPQSYLASENDSRGPEPIGNVVARQLRNHIPGE